MSTAEECTSAMAENFIPTSAGTVVAARSTGATAPVKLARVTTPASAAVNTAVSHRTTLLLETGRDGRKSPPPSEPTLAVTRFRYPGPRENSTASTERGLTAVFSLLFDRSSIFFCGDGLPPPAGRIPRLCFQAPDTWGATGREPPPIPNVETGTIGFPLPKTPSVRSSNGRSCCPQSVVVRFPNAGNCQADWRLPEPPTIPPGSVTPRSPMVQEADPPAQTIPRFPD